MASLFSILVEIAANTAKFESSITRAERQIEQFGQTVKGALEFAGVAVSLGAVVHEFDEFVNHAVNVEHAAQKTALAVEQFSHLEFAAKQAGVGTEQLTSGLEKFAKTAELAAGGSKQQAAAFAAIGVAVTDTSGHIRPMNDLLLEVADRFAGYKDSVEKTALAQLLFGKAGAELIPLLNEGRDGIEQYTKRLDELGGTLTTKDVKAAEEFHKKMNELQATLGGLWKTLVIDLLPTFTNIANAFVDTGKKAHDFETKSSGLIIALKLIVDAGYSVYRTFADIGAALFTLGEIAVVAAAGHFKQAGEIWKQYQADSQASEQKANEFLRKLWADAGVGLGDLEKKADAAGKGTGEMLSAPIVSAMKKTFDMATAMRDLFAEIDKESHSQVTGATAVDLGQRAAEEAGRAIDKTHEHWLKMRKDGDDTFKLLQAAADQAGRSMEQAFSNFLFDPFKGGVAGMVKGFLDAVRRMIADQLTIQLFKMLGTWGNANKGGGGWLGTIAGAIGGIFGGGKAEGGPVSAGSTYLVGESGPELFTPGAGGGTITPTPMGGAGHTFNHTYNIDARGADAERIMTIMPTLLAQTREATKRDILSAFERHGLAAPRSA